MSKSIARARTGRAPRAVNGLARLWRWLTARHLVCGCCWVPYREGRARPCGCASKADDPDACMVHGPDSARTEHPYRQLVAEVPRRPWSKPRCMAVGDAIYHVREAGLTRCRCGLEDTRPPRTSVPGPGTPQRR